MPICEKTFAMIGFLRWGFRGCRSMRPYTYGTFQFSVSILSFQMVSVVGYALEYSLWISILRHTSRIFLSLKENPAEIAGNRYIIEILMSRLQKSKGLSAASLRVKTLNDNP